VIRVAEIELREAARKVLLRFARMPQEVYGRGANPERIVGPLTMAEFNDAQNKLGLPAPAIRP
jgi:hypothetical protein